MSERSEPARAAESGEPTPDWLVDESLAPHTEGALAALYEASGRGELALPFCGTCGEALELDQLRCDACGSAEITWRVVEPTGTVHSSTTVHRREPGLVIALDPYHVIDVELTSGHRLLMTTDAPTATAPSIGDVAHVVFRRVGAVAIPAFATHQRPSNPSAVNTTRR
ncbi:MAG: Zn-ribbon domain-containing OB-fold protein [Acidimicrobiia bacterium]